LDFGKLIASSHIFEGFFTPGFFRDADLVFVVDLSLSVIIWRCFSQPGAIIV
jgi:hypothetical protein